MTEAQSKINFSTKKRDSSRLIVSKYALNHNPSRIRLWQVTVEAISKSNWWQMFLITVGSASSIIYPHVPLVSFAAVTGNTLTRQKALVSVMSIWFANQLYGFTIRQYPRTLESVTWGLVMGLGMLSVTWLVTLQPKFSRNNWQGYLLWLAISVVGGVCHISRQYCFNCPVDGRTRTEFGNSVGDFC